MNNWLAAKKDDSRFYGLVPGIVTNTQDPEGLGRVRVRFPWLPDNDVSAWCRVISPFAGPGYGWWQLPTVGEEVAVAFEHGDFTAPYVLGRLWNGEDKPPAEARPKAAILKTPAGHIVTVDDVDRYAEVRTAGGHAVRLDDQATVVRVSHSGGAQIMMAADGSITIHSAVQVLVDSPEVLLAGGGPGVARQGDSTEHYCPYIKATVNGSISSASSKVQSG